jgi:hypothetical protein
MSSEPRPDIDELMSLVDTSGPLPGGVEDELWASTADFYADLTDRMAGRPSGSMPTNVVELAAGGATRDQLQPGSSGSYRVWLGAAAAAVVIVAGVLVAGALRGDDGAVQPADEVTVDWVRSVAASNETLRARVTEADALRVRTIDLGLSSLDDYLASVSEAASIATGALVEPPVEVAAETIAHRDALSAWSSVSRRLRDDMAADSESFVFEEDVLDARVAEVQALEETALDVTCSALGAALGRMANSSPAATNLDSLECGVISTLLEPPPVSDQP